MKKIILVALISIMFVSCGSYRTFDLNRLTTGMTKEQVIYTVGEPQRVLAVNNTNDGYQEVLEYRTSRDEVYALEFWNDYLTGYEFLYDDVQYIAPAPPLILPDYGRPIYVGRPNNRPDRPNRPNQPNRPNESGRPSESGRNTTCATESGRPSQPSRPTESNRPEVSRPSTRPAESGRESSRPTNTNTGRESTRTETNPRR